MKYFVARAELEKVSHVEEGGRFSRRYGRRDVPRVLTHAHQTVEVLQNGGPHHYSSIFWVSVRQHPSNDPQVQTHDIGEQPNPTNIHSGQS